MSRARLNIVDFRGWRLVWILDGDEGGFIGDDSTDVHVLRKRLEQPIRSADDRDEHETAAVEIALVESGAEKDQYGFIWESLAGVKTALKLGRLALRNVGEPQPLWAAEALALGWSPPVKKVRTGKVRTEKTKAKKATRRTKHGRA